jgi:alkyl sulfatase BDS1-like metallo-beta-lactamase superfamily hydrolase
MKNFNLKNILNNNIFKKKKSVVSNNNNKTISFKKKLLKINIIQSINYKDKKSVSKFSIYKNNLKIKKIW